MSFNQKQIEMLQAPLDGSQVKTREQAGRQLSYIEGWAAIDTANRIFGHGEWGYVVTELTHIGTREVHNARTNREGWEVGYRARVVIAVSEIGATYEDVGYGTGTDYNSPFAAHESAGKEAVTDALKRALKNFGYPFGLALYDKAQEHVEYSATLGGPNDATARPQQRSDAPSRPAQAPQASGQGQTVKEASDKQRKMLFAVTKKAGMGDVVEPVVHEIKLRNDGIIPMAWMSERLDEVSQNDFSYFIKMAEAIRASQDADQKKGDAKEPDGEDLAQQIAAEFDATPVDDDEDDIPF